ncbi:ECF family sigma factor [Bordetella ansorpii]|uniref:ECF family sigma factor n=1 Tax=Bordetella ansorpii TaxID=288768 RepID=A0A157QAL8_9BORD|nr:RNA polymerase sigma factor [Bordetella ansorpii]SAI42664.1 ECF family sigma factor [Bordetella ansorpii]SAI74329.1 ECF family sigma factor [Bordetella ansorpii]
MDMSVPFYAEFAAEAGYAVGASQGGSAAALRHHLVRHYGGLHRRLAHDLGCADLASESLHEAWLRLGNMALPARVQNPNAYVYRIARNAAVDRLRGETRTVALSVVDSDVDLPDQQPGPERAAEARSLLARLDEALHGLPFRHRCVLFDLHAEGRTRAQVAATYGLSLHTLDTVLRQALACCAGAMAESGARGRPHRERAV